MSTEEIAIAATRSGTWGAWADGVTKIYPLLREQASSLRNAAIAFEDLSYAFESTDQTIYYDICHYNQQGNESIAHAVAKRLAFELTRSR